MCENTINDNVIHFCTNKKKSDTNNNFSYGGIHTFF